MLKFVIILIFLPTFCFATETPTPKSECIKNKYHAPEGSGFSGVGDHEDRNAFRGMFWTGETLKVCGGQVRLKRIGNPDSITYRISIWSVDPANHLKLLSELAATKIRGTDIVTGWNQFTFATPTTMKTGCTVILISRNDPETLDGKNCVWVSNGYDEKDEESRQWNIHYNPDGLMAGRRPNDEDQPEYFTCEWRLNAYEQSVSENAEYPNIPEDIQTKQVSSSSILISWTERGVNNVRVDHYNIYSYNTATAAVKFIASVSAPTTSYTHTGLSTGTYTYRVSAVSKSGNESYLSLKNGTAWQTTLN